VFSQNLKDGAFDSLKFRADFGFLLNLPKLFLLAVEAVGINGR